MFISASGQQSLKLDPFSFPLHKKGKNIERLLKCIILLHQLHHFLLRQEEGRSGAILGSLLETIFVQTKTFLKTTLQFMNVSIYFH